MNPSPNANRKFARAGGIEVAVCGERELLRYRGDGVTHLISIQDTGYRDDQDTARKIAESVPGAAIHRVFFNDAWQDSMEGGPNPKDIRAALAFAASARTGATLLIHCHMGISRSTAVAFAVLCDRTGPGHEAACLKAVVRIRPVASPNPAVVRLADRILGRRMAMVDALEAWKQTQPPRIWVRDLESEIGMP